LLKTLAQFLIVIVNNSDVNKMTVRNVGIVFAPTLNIPAPVFSMFLTEFDSIFDDTLRQDVVSKSVELTIEKPLGPGDIRSPRHQMFSDLPTPAYNQSSFPTLRRPEISGESGGRDPREQFDTGFVPMQPSHEQRPIALDTPSQRHGEPSQFSSINGMLTPNGSQSAKSKRRESSLLFMSMGHRKSSMPKIRDDQRMSIDCASISLLFFWLQNIDVLTDSLTAMVSDDSAFD
jgi:RalA-binding protein 1